jgi:hypothetical protein
VLKQVKNTAVVVALIFSIGLHWPLLQSVAWVNMIATFSKEIGLERAVAKTLSGKYPCKLCKFVKEAEKADKKKSASDSLKKFDLFAVASATLFIESEPSSRPQTLDLLAALRAYAPLSPPPDMA